MERKFRKSKKDRYGVEGELKREKEMMFGLRWEQLGFEMHRKSGGRLSLKPFKLMSDNLI